MIHTHHTNGLPVAMVGEVKRQLLCVGSKATYIIAIRNSKHGTVQRLNAIVLAPLYTTY